MDVIDGAVVFEDLLRLLGCKLSKEAEICNGTSSVHSTGQRNRFAGIQRLELRNGFCFGFQGIGDGVQPCDALFQ